MGAKIDMRVQKATRSKVSPMPIARTFCWSINHMSVGSIISMAVIVFGPLRMLAIRSQQNPCFEQSNLYSEESDSTSEEYH